MTLSQNSGMGSKVNKTATNSLYVSFKQCLRGIIVAMIHVLFRDCKTCELDGRDGGGKTICLDQVVHWCWKAGWLVVHVPGGKYTIPSVFKAFPSLPSFPPSSLSHTLPLSPPHCSVLLGTLEEGAPPIAAISRHI